MCIHKYTYINIYIYISYIYISLIHKYMCVDILGRRTITFVFALLNISTLI